MEATFETQMTKYYTELILPDWHTSDSQHPFQPPPFFGQGHCYQVMYEWTEVSFIPHLPQVQKELLK